MPGLEAARARWRAHVDALAETARLAFVTPGAGQAAVYWAKLDEARRWQAAVAPDPGDYPLLAAELGITGADHDEVAATIIATATAWLTVAAAIEAVRLQAKAAIDEAETEAEMQAAAAVSYPRP